MAQLTRCNFPGNIRELRNLLERASLMSDSDTIMPEHLDPEYTGFQQRESVLPDTILALNLAEQRYIQWAASQHTGGRETDRHLPIS